MMKVRIYSLIFIILISIGCVSKRYAKKGAKFEKAGMWELATNAYLKSLSKKRDNIDAIAGLKRSGQQFINEKTENLINAYNSDNLKQTVYIYLKIDSIREQASSFGVELTVSEIASQCFKDAKPKYLEKIYSEAKSYIEEEKFYQAEQLLTEVKKLQPDYGEVAELFKISKCEPIYRQAKKYMDESLYRRAYSHFDKIVREFGSYKDASELRNEALQKATITIKVNTFTSGSYQNLRIAQLVQAALTSKLNNLNNPFIKLIDAQNNNLIISEQRKSEQTGGNLEIGKIIYAKAFLNGEVNVIQISEGETLRTEKKGYLKEETKIKDPETGQESVKISYRKTVYYIIEQKNQVSIALKFQLTSTETGEVMVSDYLLSNQSDQIEYAVFNGPEDKLIPGYWEKIDVNSSKDEIYDNIPSVENLRSLLKSKRTLTPTSSLISYAVDELASKAASKINQYNPEK
ncbi:MAG: hypothetical protein N2662_01270 [Bacteroidales bacterium]|nr:hypothetical protein [Bacteroidales bacterium]